jgi:hypothetical protein
MRVWWNGRHSRLKICLQQCSIGSSPIARTIRRMIMFYILIKFENKPGTDKSRYTVQFWYNTDLRYDREYTITNFGSLEMMTEINNWLMGR